jgi:hypothetical protein
MTDRYSTSPMPMKGWLTSKKFKANCIVTWSPIGGWLIYEEWPSPPDGHYTLSFADEKIRSGTRALHQRQMQSYWRLIRSGLPMPPAR